MADHNGHRISLAPIPFKNDVGDLLKVKPATKQVRKRVLKKAVKARIEAKVEQTKR